MYTLQIPFFSNTDAIAFAQELRDALENVQVFDYANVVEILLFYQVHQDEAFELLQKILCALLKPHIFHLLKKSLKYNFKFIVFETKVREQFLPSAFLMAAPDGQTMLETGNEISYQRTRREDVYTYTSRTFDVENEAELTCEHGSLLIFYAYHLDLLAEVICQFPGNFDYISLRPKMISLMKERFCK